MHSLVKFLVATLLAVLGIGVVRPYANELSQRAWEPLVDQTRSVALDANEDVELGRSGEYVVFLEGPCDDSLWNGAIDTWIQMYDSETRLPLAMTTQDVSYAFDLGGRHSQALAIATVPRGRFELGRRTATAVDLTERGFRAAIIHAGAVESQAWKARLWHLGGLAIAVVSAIGALVLLGKD